MEQCTKLIMVCILMGGAGITLGIFAGKFQKTEGVKKNTASLFFSITKQTRIFFLGMER